MITTKGLFDMGPHMHPDDREPGHSYVSGSPFYPGHHDPLYHADFCGNNHAEDARLYIAAPDLLAALEELVAEHDLHWQETAAENPGYFPPDDTGGLILARAAIAKAKGER